eukprot:5911417-Prymnesium_polylepis.1
MQNRQYMHARSLCEEQHLFLTHAQNVPEPVVRQSAAGAVSEGLSRASPCPSAHGLPPAGRRGALECSAGALHPQERRTAFRLALQVEGRTVGRAPDVMLALACGGSAASAAVQGARPAPRARAAAAGNRGHGWPQGRRDRVTAGHAEPSARPPANSGREPGCACRPLPHLAAVDCARVPIGTEAIAFEARACNPISPPPMAGIIGAGALMGGAWPKPAAAGEAKSRGSVPHTAGVALQRRRTRQPERARGVGITPLSPFAPGMPLGGIPLGAMPLGAMPLGAMPLGAMPLGAMPLGTMPLGAMPLGAMPLGAMPLGTMPLGAMPLGAGAFCRKQL